MSTFDGLFAQPSAPRRLLARLVVGVALLTWVGWAALVPIGVHVVAPARLSPTPVALAPTVSGRVVAPAVAGSHVEAGAVVVRLDTALVDAELAGVEARIDALRSAKEALARRDLGGVARADAAAAAQGIYEAAAAVDAARAREERARQGVQVAESLLAARAGTPAERDDAQTGLSVATAERVAAEATLIRRRQEAAAARAGATTTLADADESRARLDAALAEAEGRRAELRARIELYAVRAPVAGTLAEAAPLPAGSFVDVGRSVATLIPDDALQLVASFDPTLVGRLQPGQPAEFRAAAFDWLRFGAMPTVVRSVASEAREGAVRVELDSGPSAFPAAAGLVGEVDVEVERLTPLQLLLRHAGAWVHP